MNDFSWPARIGLARGARQFLPPLPATCGLRLSFKREGKF
jgi:hypothetical protein